MRSRVKAVAAAATAALLLIGSTACSGSPGGNGSGGSNASITVRGCTPQNPLLPTNTNEVCGGNPLDASEAKLVHYNSDTAAAEMDIAKSIETTDSIHWTITLNEGYKFQDGTEVKAKNFVDAWNWGADCANGQENASFFAPIVGFTDPKGDGCSTTPTMSGLKVTGDYTFTMETEPTSNMIIRMGYTAFAPQPDAFFADTSKGKADFAKAPIAAGPYQITEVSDTQIVLTKFADYSGKWAGVPQTVTFKIYNSLDAAYQDVVANNLDATDIIPADMLVGNAWKSDLVDNGQPRWGTEQTGVIQVLTFAPGTVDPQLKDPRMREALSMGWDRKQVTDTIFEGNRTPATGWVSPVVDGYKDGQCPYCVFDATKAKQLYDAAGGYKGTLSLWVNADGGHDAWADAVCNQLKQNLGVNCVRQDTPDFKTLRTKIQNREVTGMYRGGWQMDYPSIEDFLSPIYVTGASSNDSSYSNPQFDKLIKDAAAAPSNEAADVLYQQAEALLGQDMPTMPLWYQPSQYGFSTNIKSIKMNPFSTFDFSSVVMA